jgi:serine/threonine protein kinase
LPRLLLEVGAEPFPGYTLHERRGRGGFAEVWSATNPVGDHVALKFFTSNKTTSTVREVKSLTAIQKLHHPYILPMYQVWSIPGYVVVAMELGDGSMLELLDAYQAEYRTAVEPELLCRYLTQAADALDFLNRREHYYDGRRVGWQHCDVKPSNFILVAEGIKIADFGFATPISAPAIPYAACGTLDFAAPEIHRESLTEKSDQYSLAVTYYYLRTGSFPFPPPPRKFDRQYSLTRPAPDLSLVPRCERKVLERGLAIEPADRWESCSRMMRELYDSLTNSGSSFTTSICVHADAS